MDGVWSKISSHFYRLMTKIKFGLLMINEIYYNLEHRDPVGLYDTITDLNILL